MLADNLRQTHFPYCLQRQQDGRYVVTNRNYKPIGFLMSGWATYEDYPVGVRIKGLTAKVAAKLDHKGREDLDTIYLYNDGTSPDIGKPEQTAYLERLALLMSLRIEQD